MKSIVRLMIVLSCLIFAAQFSGCGGSPQQSVQRLTITTAALPNGTSETPYSQSVQAIGGVGPFTWTVSAGALPHNVALSNSTTNVVTISGTPDTAVQGQAFTVKLADSASHTASQSYTVSILLEPDTVTLSAPSQTFAPQVVGSVSGTQPDTITNTGTSAVVISNILIGGTDVYDFGGNNTCGATIAAGANCVISNLFAPTQSGPLSATITILDNTVGSPHVIALSGVGLTSGPNATLSAASMGFATQLVGTTSPARSITLTNYGTTALNFTSIGATANFSETDNCQGSSLASGATCTINVTLTPTASGSLAGTLTITDNAPGSPQTVTLTGTGTTTSHTLTGYCFGPIDPVMCSVRQNPTECPVGQPATSTARESCGPSGPDLVDTTRKCSSGFGRLLGNCEVQ
jgi:Abnormal spindle-like microcephaly-assoc'd, ASPM-SPD-2-Hydin